MATVDWSGWLQRSPEDRRETLQRYRDIVKSESDRARFSNYARMNEALGISVIRD
jgi:hypothetical protein